MHTQFKWRGGQLVEKRDTRIYWALLFAVGIALIGWWCITEAMGADAPARTGRSQPAAVAPQAVEAGTIIIDGQNLVVQAGRSSVSVPAPGTIVLSIDNGRLVATAVHPSVAPVLAKPGVPAAIATKPAVPAATVVPAAITGVYSQPWSSMSTWAKRGVNTAFRWEGQNDVTGNPTVSRAAWLAAVKAAGMRAICQPGTDLAADAAEPAIIGWLLEPDEPNDAAISAHDQAAAAGQNETQATAAAAAVLTSLQGNYGRLHACSPGKPGYVNIDLSQLWWTKPGGDDAVIAGSCDVIVGDYYPLNRGDADLTNLSGLLDRFAAVAPGKPHLVFLECSFQNLPWPTNPRGPTSVDMANQVAMARAKGMAGILWFPQQLPGKGLDFLYDATSADQAQGLTTLSGAWVAGK